MWLKQEGTPVPILVEREAYEGVKKIAAKVADDFAAVFGERPWIRPERTEKDRAVILFATVGESPLLDGLAARGRLDLSGISGKREVFALRLVKEPWQGVGEALVVAGSDKRGTIYGMFHLSELIGVSPLVYWGDVKPRERENLELGAEAEFTSAEPSVRYRGFFINDEWPCFGGWCSEHFGGFTAEMYDHVFELLLRLKGNYLWPAMWSSCFALDGPGLAAAELADCYGVVMGSSHHEPCLRAGEEYSMVRGETSIYGNAWNYRTNREGILRFWEDGIKERGGFETVVTVGMRGERDSILDEGATLKDNIELLKDVIAEQKRLIAAEDARRGKKSPLLLAVYKEVERYFYGDGETPGLREWEGLDDVILMFCEDNFGHMRFLPEADWRGHPGGYGMYYHLDYHGSPISYEWINSTPLAQIREQMAAAYEHGVREVWIVNVGDLKGNEFPLSYFMELACDYDRYADLEGPRRFTEEWVKKQFGAELGQEMVNRLCALVTKSVDLIALRRPEALNAEAFHPYHYREADRILERAGQIEREAGELREELPETAKSAYDSMVYYSVRMGMNLVKMQLHAGKNAHYARQRKPIANRYADLVRGEIEEDRRLVQEFGAWKDGKWRHMASGAHVGFVKWNEDGSAYPTRTYVEPFPRPRMAISRADGERVLCKNYGALECLEIRDFLDAGSTEVTVEIANTGSGEFCCRVERTVCDWLDCRLSSVTVREQETLTLSCIPEKLPEEAAVCEITVGDGDAAVLLKVYGRRARTEEAPPMTFFPKNGVVAIDAAHFAGSLHPERLLTLPGYGLAGGAVKAASSTLRAAAEEAPAAVYRFFCEREGTYTAELWLAPTNPLSPDSRMEFAVGTKKEGRTFAWSVYPAVPYDYRAGEPDCEMWALGVVEQCRRVRVSVRLGQGVQELAVAFLEGSLVLERLLIFEDGQKPLPSLMGPPEGWHREG